MSVALTSHTVFIVQDPATSRVPEPRGTFLDMEAAVACVNRIRESEAHWKHAIVFIGSSTFDDTVREAPRASA